LVHAPAAPAGAAQPPRRLDRQGRLAGAKEAADDHERRSVRRAHPMDNPSFARSVTGAPRVIRQVEPSRAVSCGTAVPLCLTPPATATDAGTIRVLHGSVPCRTARVKPRAGDAY